MSRCYQLIGVPGSGKSTWVANQTWAKDCCVVSTDYWVEVFARELGKTYNDVFDEFMPAAVSAMTAQVRIAKQEGKDIIWDQTSVSAASRKKKFTQLTDYEHVAVVFATPDKEELDRRLNSRLGKEIPEHVIRSMIKNFEMPTEEEGFREIWFAS